MRRGRSLLGWAGLALLAAPAARPDSRLPWQREQTLRQAAAGLVIHGVLDAECPQPAGLGPPGQALLLNNPSIRGSIWGPPQRITISLLKSDVFDRRYADAAPVPVAKIREGAFSPKNEKADAGPAHSRRPLPGYLRPEGGRVDPYAGWDAYPFPCQKPVGQIILGLDEMKGLSPPRVDQDCADGLVHVHMESGSAQADLEILLSMERNVLAIRGKLKDVIAPWVRLYRHQDQAERRYRGADGQWVQNGYDYARDAAWNGPLPAPTSGTDGSFFWVRQRMPPEKTFPNGFEYVLVGTAPPVEQRQAEAVQNRTGLGTPPSVGGNASLDGLEEGYAAIRAAPGAAATAHLVPEVDGTLCSYVTVVTTAEAADPLAEAERRLLLASADGFQKLREENAVWYGRLYDRRESGRIFYGAGGTSASEDVAEVFRSWYCRDGGGTQPDMRRYEAGANSACLEQDWQTHHGLPSYDELFYTPGFVRNRADAADLWWKLAAHWLPAARANAREAYGAEGMMIAPGRLPPVKADRYVHTNLPLELCLDVPAQLLKVLWDQWDYGGDAGFLRDQVYPPLRELANFYASYAQPGIDGYLHLIPSMEAEAWGVLPRLSRSQDNIAALTMARWTLLRAAEAGALLHEDADARPRWRALAAKLAPYPASFTAAGPAFNSIDGAPGGWSPGDHPWFAGTYPTILSDDINLDSQKFLQDQMLRTVAFVPAPGNAEALVLLGAVPDRRAAADPAKRVVIEDITGLRGEVARFPERLVNSRSGRIWIFPCVPGWSNLAFRRFQARGGLLVSAVKEGSEIPYVEIEAQRDAECRLMNPWPGRPVAVQNLATGLAVPLSLDTTHGECLVFSADQGGDYRVSERE